jgi:hypothetical protein
MNPLEWGPWLYGKFFANYHPVWGYLFACSVALLVALVAWTQIKDKYETEHPLPITKHLSQERLTLKQLFLSDFGSHINRSRWDDRTLTVGSKSNKFPEVVLKFTPQLYLDLDEGTQFLGFYIPVQDRDPDEASKRTAMLCRHLPTQFPALLKMLHGLEAIEPNARGSTVRSSELPLSRRVYIYHEDFISPQDLGDLVREYEARQLLPEFRGTEYLASQELLRAVGQKK